VNGLPARQIDIETPAKLNLGLEIIGRREDGFHEIATILVGIDIYDTLRLTSADTISIACDEPALTGIDNLAMRALAALRDDTGFRGGARIELTKRIPAAAGLGGGSSDAAAALLAGRELWQLDVADDALRSLAARLGSDVPFFLDGGCAVARGRGEVLTPVPLPGAVWFVVVVPALAIPNKTATLYAHVRREDFSDGARIGVQETRLAVGLALGPELLGNAFSRPLYDVAPALTGLPDVMRDAGAAAVALSGAGPAHYAPFASITDAESTASRLRGRLEDRAQVFVAWPAPPRRARSGPL